eukprot:9495105-Pyramimonas_sp.AAC.1
MAALSELRICPAPSQSRRSHPPPTQGSGVDPRPTRTARADGATAGTGGDTQARSDVPLARPVEAI